MTTYYNIDSEHGNSISEGIQSEIVARRHAQETADRLGESVYLYEVGSGDGESEIDSEEISPRDKEIIAALSAHDRGDGCLGIMVRAALRNDPNATIDEIRDGIREAEQDAALEREQA